MEKGEAYQLLKKLGVAFPGTIPKNPETMTAWAEILEDVQRAAGEAAVKRMGQELETIYPGSNLGAMIRNRANPVISQATIEHHLRQARYLASSPAGDPFRYLRKVSQELLDMAERADLFARDLTSESAGFRMRDIARQFLESRENTKRGFGQLELVPHGHRASLPPAGMTEEQRQFGLAKCREILGRLKKKDGLLPIGSAVKEAVKKIKGQEKPWNTNARARLISVKKPGVSVSDPAKK